MINDSNWKDHSRANLLSADFRQQVISSAFVSIHQFSHRPVQSPSGTRGIEAQGLTRHRRPRLATCRPRSARAAVLSLAAHVVLFCREVPHTAWENVQNESVFSGERQRLFATCR